MDCPKCGCTLAPLETRCPRCARIAQEEFARSPAAVWPPAIGPAAAEPAPPLRPTPVPPVQKHREDNSEQNSSGEERGCPLEIAELHWNWGAFFCGWLWCFVNAAAGQALLILGVTAFFVYFTIALLPAGYALPSEMLALVLFGLHCNLGIRGHQLAWERRRFYGGTAQFFAVQRAWLIGGGIAFGLTASFLTVSTIAFFKTFNVYEARRLHPAPLPASAAPSSPPPMVLRPASPAASNPPTYLRSPENGEYGGPGRPVYRPGYGPGDVRILPDEQTVPAAAPAASPSPESTPPSAVSFSSPPDTTTAIAPAAPTLNPAVPPASPTASPETQPASSSPPPSSSSPSPSSGGTP